MIIVPPEVSQFFLGVVKETMDYREEGNITRNDFMQLLIQLKNKGKLDDADDGLTGNEKSNSKYDKRKKRIIVVIAKVTIFYCRQYEIYIFGSGCSSFCIFHCWF